MFQPTKYPFLVLFIAILGIVFSFYFIPNLKANYNFKDFFPKGDPELVFYKEFQQEFGTDEHLLMLAFSNQPSIFDSSFLQKIHEITLECRKSPFIEKAQSLTTLKNIRKTPFGTVQRPLLSTNQAAYEEDSIKLFSDPRLLGFFLSENAQHIAISLELNSESQNDSLINFLENIPQKYELHDYHIGGEIYTQISYIRMLETENFQLIPLFALCVTLVLILLYRGTISILVPTISVILGLIYLYGYAAAIGRNINLSTLMFPTIMTVVGMSDLIHFYTKYQSELRAGEDRKTAITNSLSEIRTTLFLTSLTTIIGFLSVSLSSLPHVKTFGLDGAVGVGIAFLIAVNFTPVMLSFLPEKKVDASRVNWDKVSLWIHQFNQKHPKEIVLFCGLLLLLSIYGISKIDTNNYLLGSISDNAKLKQDFLFFENELAGVRAFELAIFAQNDHQLNELEILQELEKLENHLKNYPSIGPVFSPLTFYKTAYSVEKGQGLAYYRLPEREGVMKNLDKYLNRIPNRNLISEDLKNGRLNAKMQDIGRLEVRKMNAEIRNWISKNIPEDLLRFQFTGHALLIDKSNDEMVGQMFKSFLLAFTLISMIIAWLFRSFKMVVFSLIPNLLPLILTAGIMGFIGVELNGSTAIIFTIAFVIAVDDTIHFLRRFKMEIDKNIPTIEALKNTLLHTGKAIMITSIILISGYFLLFFSDFREAYYHGVLICFTLFWALLADLFLLPVLLERYWKKLKA